MTNTEAKDKLYLQWQEFLEHNLDYGGISEAYKMSFKALDQMDIIDKIRAEIEQNAYPIVHGVNNHELGMTLYGILQVIDKYREQNTLYKYKVTKIWYSDEEIIESETPLDFAEIRQKVDEKRIYCDEIDVEEIEE